MNTIEVMLEALKASTPSSFSGNTEIAKWHKLRNDAIAAGEAELRMEPVAWIEWDYELDEGDPDSIVGGAYKPESSAEGWKWIPMYLREEIK